MDLFGVGSAIQGVGAITGAALNYKGAKLANKTNIQLAREQTDFQRQSNQQAMDFSADQVQKQMDFQERMSNTSYQRAMADMQAAGLNPILAYNQGGASSPSGSSAQGVSSSGSRAEVRNKYSAAVSSALAIRQAEAQIEQTKVLTKLAEADLPEKLLSAKIYSSLFGGALKGAKVLGGPVSSVLPIFRFLKAIKK